MQAFGQSLQPQPEYSLPQGNSYPSVPTQNYQHMPQGQQMQPMGAPPTQYLQPQQLPSTPLPPLPQNYPAQGRMVPTTTNGQQPSMLSRMGSVFRRNNQAQNNVIKPAGWTRQAQK